VVYLSAEDNLADTIRPRLDMADADTRRVHALTGVETHAGDDSREASVTLRDLDILDQTLAETGAVLCVIDPIQAYLGPEIDMHRANEVRPILAGLSKLAERHNCVVLAVRHLTKNQTGRAAYRGLGSIDFSAAARSVLLVGRDPRDASQRAFVHLLCSNAPEGPAMGFEIKDGRFQWTGVSDVTAEELLAPDDEGYVRSRRLEKSSLDDAVQFLTALLGSEPVLVTVVEALAATAGISMRTLRRAKAQLGVRSVRQGFGPGGSFLWSLPHPTIEGRRPCGSGPASYGQADDRGEDTASSYPSLAMQGGGGEEDGCPPADVGDGKG
jgi:hypothetical protein